VKKHAQQVTEGEITCHKLVVNAPLIRCVSFCAACVYIQAKVGYIPDQIKILKLLLYGVYPLKFTVES